MRATTRRPLLSQIFTRKGLGERMAAIDGPPSTVAVAEHAVRRRKTHEPESFGALADAAFFALDPIILSIGRSWRNIKDEARATMEKLVEVSLEATADYRHNANNWMAKRRELTDGLTPVYRLRVDDDYDPNFW